MTFNEFAVSFLTTGVPCALSYWLGLWVGKREGL